eukprot:4435408-Pyramimonas_sp.AAC.1
MPRPQHAQSEGATHHGVQTKHDTTVARCLRDQETERNLAHCRCGSFFMTTQGCGKGGGEMRVSTHTQVGRGHS